MRLQPTSEDIPQRLPRRVVFAERLKIAADMLALIATDNIPAQSHTRVHLSVAIAVLDDLAAVMERERLIPQRVRP